METWNISILHDGTYIHFNFQTSPFWNVIGWNERPLHTNWLLSAIARDTTSSSPCLDDATDIEPNTQKNQKYQMITFISTTIKSWLVFRILTKKMVGMLPKCFFWFYLLSPFPIMISFGKKLLGPNIELMGYYAQKRALYYEWCEPLLDLFFKTGLYYSIVGRWPQNSFITC